MLHLCWFMLTCVGLLLLCVDSCSTGVDLCWLVVGSCWFVLTCVGLVVIQVHSCSTRTDSWWLVSNLYWFVLTFVRLLLTYADLCWYSCTRINFIKSDRERRLCRCKFRKRFFKNGLFQRNWVCYIFSL